MRSIYLMIYYYRMQSSLIAAWNMDQSNHVFVQVTGQVVINWQRPAKSNYDLFLSFISKFNWMHYFNDVKLFWMYQMIYYCDENETIYMKINSDSDSNTLLWFHTLGLPTMVAHIIL